MTSFPLYDSLIKDIPKKDLTVKQKEEFVEKIEKIDENGRDLVYTLIQFYNIDNCDEELSEDLPYNGVREEIKKGKENLTWTFTDFPIKLRHLLYKFVVMHTQNMDLETARREEQLI